MIHDEYDGARDIPAFRLLFELGNPEAKLNPNPLLYQEAGHLLARNFEAIRKGDKFFEDESIENALDSVASIVGGFYSRDMWSHRMTTRKPIGEHPSDIHLVEGLMAGHEALVVAEQQGTSKGFAKSRDILDALGALEASRASGSYDDERLRDKTSDLLRQAVRTAPLDDSTRDSLLKLGTQASLAIVCLAPIAAKLDNSEDPYYRYDQAPLFKDYLVMHTSEVLKQIAL